MFLICIHPSIDLHPLLSLHDLCPSFLSPVLTLFTPRFLLYSYVPFVLLPSLFPDWSCRAAIMCSGSLGSFNLLNELAARPSSSVLFCLLWMCVCGATLKGFLGTPLFIWLIDSLAKCLWSKVGSAFLQTFPPPWCVCLWACVCGRASGCGMPLCCRQLSALKFIVLCAVWREQCRGCSRSC